VFGSSNKEKCTSKKPDHHNSYIGCDNPEMRYIYNPDTKNCHGFLYTLCDGPDVYFTSYYDCQDQCGSMYYVLFFPFKAAIGTKQQLYSIVNININILNFVNPAGQKYGFLHLAFIKEIMF
jgi:hypothetical protein